MIPRGKLTASVQSIIRATITFRSIILIQVWLRFVTDARFLRIRVYDDSIEDCGALLQCLVLAQPIEQPLRERSPLGRELIDTGAQVRAQLPLRVGEIAHLTQLVQRLTVMLENRSR